MMDLKLNATLIRQEREKRAWSQEHLADVTGLALRTIQRIESSGSASYDSAGAIASVLNLPVATLRVDVPDSPPSALAGRPWFSWHRLATLAGCALLTAILTPPHFRVTLPVALVLWVACEIAIRTRRA